MGLYTDGEDYKAIQELLVTFPPGGSSERQVLVTILDDDVPEGKEDFRAELSLLPNETEVVLGEASIAVIEIVDDDVGRFVITARALYGPRQKLHSLPPSRHLHPAP